MSNQNFNQSSNRDGGRAPVYGSQRNGDYQNNRPALPPVQLTGDDLIADEATVLRLMVQYNDVAVMTHEQRHVWYLVQCEQAGLDPKTQPFIYVTLSGKMTLYATKKAAEMLCQKQKISTEIVGEREVRSAYLFKCRAKTPDGRVTDATGGASLNDKYGKELTGENLANAIMKAETKSRRRAVLAHCGLGMLDETEVETIPNALVMASKEQLDDYAQIRREAMKMGFKTGAGNDPKELDQYTPEEDVLDRTNALKRWVERNKKAPAKSPSAEQAPASTPPAPPPKKSASKPPLPPTPDLEAFQNKFDANQDELTEFFTAAHAAQLPLETDEDFRLLREAMAAITQAEALLELNNWGIGDVKEATALMANGSLVWGQVLAEAVA